MLVAVTLNPAALGLPSHPELTGPGIDVNAVAGLAPSPAAQAYVVIDGGTSTALDVTPSEDYLVTRPCYLALRRALASDRRPQGVVALLEPDRSLTRSDIEVVRLPSPPSGGNALASGLVAQVTSVLTR